MIKQFMKLLKAKMCRYYYLFRALNLKQHSTYTTIFLKLCLPIYKTFWHDKIVFKFLRYREDILLNPDGLFEM